MKLEKFNLENLIEHILGKRLRKKNLTKNLEIYHAQELLKDSGLSTKDRNDLLKFVRERVDDGKKK